MKFYNLKDGYIILRYFNKDQWIKLVIIVYRIIIVLYNI